MKKLKTIFTFLLSLFFITGFFATYSAADSEQSVTLTYSNFFPPTHIQSQLAEQWCKEVEKRTNGQVEIQYYPGQTLTKANQCYDGVVEGLSDIGFSVLAYSKGRFPVLGTVDLPLGYTSGIAATKVANEIYKKFQPKEFDDTKVLYFHAHGPGLIHTKKKPIKKLEDLKGVKLRATGNSAALVKALGATPVATPMPEAYQSIQKGTVDGGMYPLESNKGWKLGEVTDYSTAAFSCAYTTVFFVVMNKDKWNALPDNTKKIIEEINIEWAQKHGQAWDASDVEGIKFFLNEGNQIIGIDKKEAEKWKKAALPMIEAYQKELDKKGLNGKEIITFTQKTLKSLQ
jgi:TRAP-type C4-dicarboxylate transport system substrate-binding protein